MSSGLSLAAGAAATRNTTAAAGDLAAAERVFDRASEALEALRASISSP